MVTGCSRGRMIVTDPTRMRAVALVLVGLLLWIGRQETRVSADATLQRWREFTYGKVRPDGVEYFDFEVRDGVYKVFLAFDRGDLHGRAPPTLLVKRGSFPTTDSYDQILLVNTTDYATAQIDYLRPGHYFVAVDGGSLFDSLRTFVGRGDNLFYFFSVWYFGCSDGNWAGTTCSTPMVQAKPPSVSTLPANYRQDSSTVGCVDESRFRMQFVVQVTSIQWDLSFELSTASPRELAMVVAPGLLDPMDLVEFEDSSLVRLEAAPKANSSATQRTATVHITAPSVGRWLVRIYSTPVKNSSCSNGNGIEFTVRTYHEQSCENISETLVPVPSTSRRSQRQTDQSRLTFCDVEFRPLSEVRYHTVKEEFVLNAWFRAFDSGFDDDVQESQPDFPIAGFIAELPKLYAGADLEFRVFATSNIQSFVVVVCVDAYPTLSQHDYIFASNQSTAVSLNMTDTFEWWPSNESSMAAESSRLVFMFSFDHVTFPKIGTWYILVIADDVDESTNGLQGERDFWGIDVELVTSGCQDHGCANHGSCEIAQTYKGLNYGSCQCHYGYGGDYCQQHSISDATRVSQSVLVISSNAAIVPVVIATLGRKLYIESVLFMAAGLVSAIYHLCDMEVGCLFQYKSLQAMDFALAFNMILVLSVHLSGARKQIKAGLQALFLIFTVFLAMNDATSMVNWAVIATLGVVQFSGTLAYYWVIGYRRLHQGTLAVLLSFFAVSNNFDWRFAALGAAMWAGALTCWFTSSTSNYWLVHSLWHIHAMLAAFCFIRCRRNDRYRMLNAEGIDVLGPQFTSVLPMKTATMSSVSGNESAVETNETSRQRQIIGPVRQPTTVQSAASNDNN